MPLLACPAPTFSTDVQNMGLFNLGLWPLLGNSVSSYQSVGSLETLGRHIGQCSCSECELKLKVPKPCRCTTITTKIYSGSKIMDAC